MPERSGVAIDMVGYLLLESKTMSVSTLLCGKVEVNSHKKFDRSKSYLALGILPKPSFRKLNYILNTGRKAIIPWHSTE